MIFFLELGELEPIGECELFLHCHCDSKGLTAIEVGLKECVSRARDTFTAENDGGMAVICGCCLFDEKR